MTSHLWTISSALPQLPSNAIHLWSVRLDMPGGGDGGGLWSLLSADEVERAEALGCELARQRFIVCRSLLRRLLGHYLQVDPRQIRFRYTAHGKPELAEPFSGSEVRFNVSHSDRMGAIALARGVEMGVDIERLRALSDMAALVRRYFAPAEQELIERAPERQRLQMFFRIWTGKEAVLKALGAGLSLPVERVVIALGDIPQVVALPVEEELAASWLLRLFEPAPGYAAAVAAPQGRLELRHYEWQQEAA